MTLSGETVTHTFLEVGDYEVNVEMKSRDSLEVVASSKSTVRSRYVRRELRSLTDHDRGRFFDTMQTIWNTSCTDGKSLYGEEFECIDTFVRVHNTLAGDPYCDHMHDGYGFLVSHTALSQWFERVLQTVNPDVSLAYWDYTIEGQAVTEANHSIAPFRQSEVWDDEWFGPSETAHTDYVVATGRWAYTPVTKGVEAHNYSKYTNAYGMMRAPWNQNSIPYLTRSNTTYGFELTQIPDCQSHLDQMKFDTFADFAKWMQYSPHGTTHLAIGGVFNADWRNVLKAANYDLKLAPVWTLIGFAIQKNMYRAGYLECPVTCSPDATPQACKCTCPDIAAYMNSSVAKMSVLDQVFAGQGIYFWDKDNNDVTDLLIRLLCNDYDEMAPVMGDSLEAASPLDPSFWPTHPTPDRLLHWRRLLGFNDTEWPDNESWSVQGFAIAYCYLHNEDDVGPWPTLFKVGFAHRSVPRARTCTPRTHSISRTRSTTRRILTTNHPGEHHHLRRALGRTRTESFGSSTRRLSPTCRTSTTTSSGRTARPPACRWTCSPPGSTTTGP